MILSLIVSSPPLYRVEDAETTPSPPLYCVEDAETKPSPPLYRVEDAKIKASLPLYRRRDALVENTNICFQMLIFRFSYRYSSHRDRMSDCPERSRW